NDVLTDAQITGASGAYTALSSGDGLYSFNEITPGTYTLNVKKNGYLSASASVTVSPGQVTHQDFSLVVPTGAAQLGVGSNSFHHDLNIGDSVLDDTFFVRNVGAAGSTLNYNLKVITGGDWLSVSPLSGPVSSPSAAPIDVQYTTSTLA